MNKPGYNHQPSSVVVFRTDASLQVGSGHVMRCLTLATALREQGAACHFLCREHSGHLIDMIEARDFTAHRLTMPRQTDCAARESDGQPAHAHWLGTSWQADAEACRPVLAHLAPDWLVVDHYALDARWEEAVLPESTRLMVIDDLADRPHRADLLLDQNLGRDVADYAHWVPANCQVLTGPHFALLRPEFAALRKVSLARRHQHPPFKRLLISLGGVDKDNVTGQVLSALRDCDLPPALDIEVVMGATAPWLDEVRHAALTMPWPTNVVVNISDMAQRMADADLAIGAAGSTSWERCCLGLPTLMIVLAENQRQVASALDNLGAAKLLGPVDVIAETLPSLLNKLGSSALFEMSKTAATLVLGSGTEEVLAEMEQVDEAYLIGEIHL
ncbi:UDP-2,4-diacetamido-2,4,6-trideoxy-beta-L-altropyranose hydrolase [Halomonas sp. ZH2S]|uniref:UDP-2,4-diacetamido-2,4, 6-trideoxy-beta-L-altropyranose hydrolase n=1 Tax=Vreelandella zhuhanensis TaxID=2684210 RepID=A0A7X3GZA6_9GAMM|nr:UDP-2,4-diacetamido-2,4,6-trideoxy-beta-L-altropyranose hydrolase [Halomonas zhuhanensis]MWJ27632.1 UDP-2,4-diacetamido-2,4,6-trideoxy-beta-L-altropyranose hydrolase [Halomonas zhuhanensis]